MRLEDPKPKKNGGCAVCGRPRPPIAIVNGDPFCTSTCARKYHGTELMKGAS